MPFEVVHVFDPYMAAVAASTDLPRLLVGVLVEPQ